jgi:hypothetical protein
MDDLKQIEVYWTKTRKYDAFEAAMIIQRSFKRFLKRMRDKLQNINDDKNKSSIQNITLVQTAIRQWAFTNRVQAMLNEKRRKDQKFQEFCKLMCKGIKMGMISKKYNNRVDREFYINPVLFTLNWKKSSFYITAKDLRLLVRISVNQSKDKAFTLHFLDGFNIELFADINKSFAILSDGFSHLIKLIQSRGCLFIDKHGIPSRSSSSIIQNALNYT